MLSGREKFLGQVVRLKNLAKSFCFTKKKKIRSLMTVQRFSYNHSSTFLRYEHYEYIHNFLPSPVFSHLENRKLRCVSRNYCCDAEMEEGVCENYGDCFGMGAVDRYRGAKCARIGNGICACDILLC